MNKSIWHLVLFSLIGYVLFVLTCSTSFYMIQSDPEIYKETFKILVKTGLLIPGLSLIIILGIRLKKVLQWIGSSLFNIKRIKS
ncbi:hypothetical protein SAMN04489761_3378 [Tenacibaculum sp. MAR_2009_124]|nr:hypothetical protein SAMN04489761_3378 [Tenacibaculum sp. MAR_2009_124]